MNTNMTMRASERVYFDDERIAWGPGSGGPLAPGRFEDISKDGALIAVIGEPNVGHGDTIRTLSRFAVEARRARVVRIEQNAGDDGPETRLGCRWIGGSKHHTSITPRGTRRLGKSIESIGPQKGTTS